MLRSEDVRFEDVPSITIETYTTATKVFRELVRSVTVVAEPAFDAEFPGKRQARVTVALADGSTRSHLRHTRKGDPRRPAH